MAKKRANGEGNIRKRKDGRWEGRYTAGYDEKTGKRITKSVLDKTQAEVKEKLTKAVAEAEAVDVRRADEYTLGTWLQTWYELYAKPHRDSRLPNTTGAASNCISRRASGIFR